MKKQIILALTLGLILGVTTSGEAESFLPSDIYVGAAITGSFEVDLSENPPNTNDWDDPTKQGGLCFHWRI